MNRPRSAALALFAALLLGGSGVLGYQVGNIVFPHNHDGPNQGGGSLSPSGTTTFKSGTTVKFLSSIPSTGTVNAGIVYYSSVTASMYFIGNNGTRARIVTADPSLVTNSVNPGAGAFNVSALCPIGRIVVNGTCTLVDPNGVGSISYCGTTSSGSPPSEQFGWRMQGTCLNGGGLPCTSATVQANCL